MLKNSVVSLVMAATSFAANAQHGFSTFLSEQIAVPYGPVVNTPVWQLNMVSTASRVQIKLENGFGGVCGASVVGVNVATLGNQVLGALRNNGGGVFESNVGRTLQITHLQVVLSQTSYNIGYCRVTAASALDQPLTPMPIPGPIDPIEDPAEDSDQVNDDFSPLNPMPIIPIPADEICGEFITTTGGILQYIKWDLRLDNGQYIALQITDSQLLNLVQDNDQVCAEGCSTGVDSFEVNNLKSR